jgi:hypothetical protein
MGEFLGHAHCCSTLSVPRRDLLEVAARARALPRRHSPLTARGCAISGNISESSAELTEPATIQRWLPLSIPC